MTDRITKTFDGKKPKTLMLTSKFHQEIQEIHSYLLSQGPHKKRWWFDEIPSPFSSGNELEFRYYAYEDLVKLIQSILQEYIDKKFHKQIFKQIPKSPLLILKNGKNNIFNLKD